MTRNDVTNARSFHMPGKPGTSQDDDFFERIVMSGRSG